MTIVKKCKKHGELTKSQVFHITRPSRPSIYLLCKQCNLLSVKKYTKTDKYKKVIRHHSANWKKNNPDAYKAKYLKRAKYLTDSYVKNQLKREIPLDMISQGLIDLKRAIMQIKRSIKSHPTKDLKKTKGKISNADRQYRRVTQSSIEKLGKAR